MDQHFKRKKDRSLLKDLSLPIVSFLLFIVLFNFGIQSVSQTAEDQQLRFAEQAVRRAAVQCYTIEGRYPANVEYLKENYGLAVDGDRYVIHYQRLGGNLLPEIAVFPVEKGQRE
ncbi:MAG: hypothetical protein HFK04_00840 [Oscillospiraceae bacterium]|nr:hypothetical protein [Oscillospiraceae bacterium]